MEYVLETMSLCKNYGKANVLKNVNMRVPKGSIYGLVGKNGAGKTTIIRVICGLQDPSSGNYTLYGYGNNDNNIYKSRKRMGAVVESPAIYQNMSAKDNMIQQFNILGIPSYDGIDDLLELVGLKDVGKKHVKKFSLGMKQRLGIAIALAGNPDFIILDEPINGLDPQGIIEIRELLLKLNREKGITILISSHILSELSLVATHYGFMNDGTIIKEVDAKELENSCRKCMEVTVDNTKKLAKALEKNNIRYEIISDTKADVYAKLSLSEFVVMLNEEGCKLVSMDNKDETLESFYINLLEK